MVLFGLAKLLLPCLPKASNVVSTKKCHSIFGIQKFLQQPKPDFLVCQIEPEDYDIAIDIVKSEYLSQHVLCQSRKIDLSDDRAIDEYLVGLLKQGNSLYARTHEGLIAGLSINYASAPIDPSNLRQYAFYRQDPNTKDLLYFNAKLQETPNLWKLFEQPKIFEIRMLTVQPQFRRQGLAILLAEKSRELARDQNYHVVRLDCLNEFDFKIAERCMMRCIIKFPLHLLRGNNAPFIKKSSEFNRCARVYVDANVSQNVLDTALAMPWENEFENMIE